MLAAHQHATDPDERVNLRQGRLSTIPSQSNVSTLAYTDDKVLLRPKMGADISAIGERTAVISLGTSCQTSEQINRNIDLIRALTGDHALEVRAFPFDAVIAEPESVMKALSQKRPYPSADQLEFFVKPYWRRCNIYYWHHFIEGNSLAAGERLDHFNDLYRRRAKRLRWALESEKRLIFVVSNTQPDLLEKGTQTRSFNPVITAAAMRSLQRTLRKMANREIELIVVTTKGRFRGLRWLQPFRICMQPSSVAKPGLPWQGDASAWNRSFADGLSETLSARLVARCRRFISKARIFQHAPH